jgi:hypothetical protein
MPQPTAAVLDQHFEMVEVRTLVTHPRNPNEGDYGAIQESVETNGFWGALVVQRSTRYVLVGNHRLVVARDAGITHVPVLWVDVDDTQALRILTGDNRTARLGSDKTDLLTEILIELAMSPTGLAGTGYDGDDLDAMMAELNQTLEAAAAKEAKATPIEVVISCDASTEGHALWDDIGDCGAVPSKVTVTCDSADQQRELLARLSTRGYAVKGKGG